MKKKSMLLVGVLILTIIFSLVGCGAESAGSTTVTTTKTYKKSFKKEGAIKKQTLYNKNGVKIVATDLSYDSYQAVLNLKVFNNTNKKISVIAQSMMYAVNGINNYVVPEGYFNCEVPAKKTKSDVMRFTYSNLLAYGINQISTIQTGFDISDKNYTIHDKTGILTIKTDVDKDGSDGDWYETMTNAGFDKKYGLSVTYKTDEELYKSNNIRILSEIYATNEDKERTLFLEVENKNKELVYGRIGNIKINGVKIGDDNWDTVCITPNKRAILTIGVDNLIEYNEDDLKTLKKSAKDFKKINTIDFKFSVLNDSFDDIADPANMSVKLK